MSASQPPRYIAFSGQSSSTISPHVYNMLVGNKTDDQGEEDLWSNFAKKKKSKGVKKREKPLLDVPLPDDSAPLEPVVDDSGPREPMEMNHVPEPEPAAEARDIVPSPPDQLPKDEEVEMKSAEDGTEREHKSKGDKHIDAAGWAFTWCFRCKREDVLKFGGKTLPE
ncbi:hypothetical protein LTR37_018538 [Vermiconidia calcicola]|uniref:Uncharacterized protein n=1 Tax=Vermiconidia calcicola TaxID=1690605 RepID=A0ACC3MH02_9PEZI|nr:hypothetical protein LTR37_018538 [Vermiconidia calcicola]